MVECLDLICKAQIYLTTAYFPSHSFSYFLTWVLLFDRALYKLPTEHSVLTSCLLDSALSVLRVWIPCLFPFPCKFVSPSSSSMKPALPDFSKSHNSCLYHSCCQLIIFSLGLLCIYPMYHINWKLLIISISFEFPNHLA